MTNQQPASGPTTNNPRTSKPHVLIILDGWGHRDEKDANAIKLANTPVWDALWKNRPHCLISASGTDVGLPANQMGNSEVGHMNLGAGRVVNQDLTRIAKAIDDGSYFSNPVICDGFDKLRENGQALHIFGLLSAGGVHSHQDHIQATIKLAFNKGVKQVFVHAFLDGRDVAPRCAESSLQLIQETIEAHGEGGIASIIGRYYAMDRDNRWERVKPAYDLLTQGIADFSYDCPLSALTAAYARNESDEFVSASAIRINDKTVTINHDDSVIFMNFRADRARAMSHAFVTDNFSGFERQYRPRLTDFITLTRYAEDLPTACAFNKDSIKNSLGEYVASLGKQQLRLAETEKYAHVTFFFSGGIETPFSGETRQLVPSPDVATYDLQPTMSATAITRLLVETINARQTDLIICNFANGDMVGHTGNLSAAITAVECVDQNLALIIEAVESVAGHCIITADHGNVEQMTNSTTGQPHTAHTSELVPLIYIGTSALQLKQTGGSLQDVSPTLLAIMALPQPDEMTGKTLIV
ncbi:MAG: 2,3-bisphosphoglycerate-independent phosphoglycerate mutase [Pseudomonadales bacterium]|nr:2,3-bisphosphoglycerate-independent phosphoglycerate mutase [Pseudomonadales bacterium]